MIKKVALIFSLMLSICLIANSNTSFAASLTAKPEVKRFIKETAKKYHLSTGYLNYILSRARFNPEVIYKMQTPYEEKPWHDYHRLFITEKRIQSGVKYWHRSNKLIAWEEREYAVPGGLIIAMLGMETNYGKDMGHLNVLNTLATLAFEYPPRARFFQQQLAAYLALTKIYKMRPDALQGSYAGALGQPQFMPLSYLNYAVDFHGKGKPNLFNDKADIIFSVGNYLRQHGYEPHQPIATRARVIGMKYRDIVKSDTRKPQPPTMSLATLAKYGVYPAHGNYDLHLRANLIRLDGEHGPEYWLAFHNFYVITTFNNSDLYAMAAYQLSKRIKTAYEATLKKHE